ncbi:MAG: prepilin-type N-terminal cleavage/methylation domain-containing protein [bacterium]
MKVIFSKKNKQIVKLKNGGFTMIELIVVLGIFAVIMGAALFNQTGLNSSILITNLAYETALSVREAQTYGIGVRATASANPNFNMGYGAYFDMGISNQVVVFGDADDNKVPRILESDGQPSEVQSMYQIQNQRGNKITGACVAHGTDPACMSLQSSEKLAIMFKRPNPEATFYVVDASLGVTQAVGPARIIVNNAEGTNCRAIVVEVTGQIRVENPGVPNPGLNCTTPTTPIP